MTDEKLFELHEKVKDAKVNGGFVTLAASELAELLPAQPVIVEAKPSEPAVGDNHQPTRFTYSDPISVAATESLSAETKLKAKDVMVDPDSHAPIAAHDEAAAELPVDPPKPTVQ